MKLAIYQIDAFTETVFRGNPAAVVPLDEWLPDAVMQNIAAENNLAETAFFVKDGDVFELRWFTPTIEVPLCGHATLASSYVIFNELGFAGEEIVFKTRKAGDLKVTRNGERYLMDFPAYEMTEIDAAEAFRAAGFTPIRCFESQGNMIFFELDDQRSVAEFEPDMAKIAELPYQEVIITAKGDDCDFASRMFAPRIGIPEDPVTGAIHCSLVPFWAREFGKNELFARQISKRGGELFCESSGDRVKIGGNAVMFLRGEIVI